MDKFINGSDHEMVASYLELYEEGEVEHINGVWTVLNWENLPNNIATVNADIGDC